MTLPANESNATSGTTGERALLIWNPVAGRWPQRRKRKIERLAEALRAGGWQVDAVETVAGGGARPMAERARRDGYSVVVACGGDGTLNQIAQELLQDREGRGKAPNLAVVPFGTANVLANALGCPGSPDAAAAWLLRARPRMAALGRLRRGTESQCFLAVASVGVDAEAVHQLRFEHKRRWGKLAYAATALTVWKRYFPAPIEFEVAGGRHVADGIVVGLTRFYGGRMRLGRVAAGASIALALRGAPRRLPGQALALATVGLEHAPGVERLPQAPIHILTPGRPIEIDGEPCGFTPAWLEVVAGGICILMPPV